MDEKKQKELLEVLDTICLQESGLPLEPESKENKNVLYWESPQLYIYDDVCRSFDVEFIIDEDAPVDDSPKPIPYVLCRLFLINDAGKERCSQQELNDVLNDVNRETFRVNASVVPLKSDDGQDVSQVVLSIVVNLPDDIDSQYYKTLIQGAVNELLDVAERNYLVFDLLFKEEKEENETINETKLLKVFEVFKQREREDARPAVKYSYREFGPKTETAFKELKLEVESIEPLKVDESVDEFGRSVPGWRAFFKDNSILDFQILNNTFNKEDSNAFLKGSLYLRGGLNENDLPTLPPAAECKSFLSEVNLEFSAYGVSLTYNPRDSDFDNPPWIVMKTAVRLERYVNDPEGDVIYVNIRDMLRTLFSLDNVACEKLDRQFGVDDESDLS